jgi:hypothetical protein
MFPARRGRRALPFGVERCGCYPRVRFLARGGVKAVTLSPHSKILRWGCFGVRRLDAAFVDAGVVERTSPGTATLQFRIFRRWGEEGARNPGSAVVYRQTNETKKLDWIVRL